MLIFAIIIFALAGVRTLANLVETLENGETLGSKIGASLVAITYWWCYIWFLIEHVNLK